MRSLYSTHSYCMKIHNSWYYCFTNPLDMGHVWISETIIPRVVYLHSQDVSPRGFSRDH